MSSASLIDRLERLRAGIEVVLGAVALPTARVLQANETSEPGMPFAKQGLAIRADAEAEITLPAGGNGVRVEWSELEVKGHGTVCWVGCMAGLSGRLLC